MIIRSISYKNFRNFEKAGKVEFDTDGKVTIVYGMNGEGKTTFHQLFQWILYGEVHFNKTASKKMYNLDAGAKLGEDRQFCVSGKICFSHEGEEYQVSREWWYYKNKNGNIIRKSEDDFFEVIKQDENNDWKSLDNPEIVINNVLPKGLSAYFFFDGETMIADLKMSGSESAKSLRKALYTILELELYEKACNDIGKESQSQTVLGELNKRKLKAQEKAKTDKNVRAQLMKQVMEVRKLTQDLEKNTNLRDAKQKEYDENEIRIAEIATEIGKHQSKKALENARKVLEKDNETREIDIKREQKAFGKEVTSNYTYLLISDVVKEAKTKIYLEVQEEEKKIIPGLTKELLINLLMKENKNCICGNPLCEEERKNIEEWKKLFPPASYKSTYDKFERNAVKYSGNYQEDRLKAYLMRIVEYKEKIRENSQQISDLDDQIKESGNFDELIDERKKLESRNRILKPEITELDKLIGKVEHKKNIRDKSNLKLSEADATVRRINSKIEFMKQVKDLLEKKLSDETEEYRELIGEAIRELVASMLTSKRIVEFDEEFRLIVKDSHGDESKSEGQFAVVSFAYIGGVLKVLKESEYLKGKEYPLILDGPFSKLDAIQKQNVLSEIPKNVPQVVVFSKDPLFDSIASDKIGKIWTIKSNVERNNATIEEGYLW